MCAAIVSARRPGSSMPVSEVSTSAGTFLLSVTYFSKLAVVLRTRPAASSSGTSTPSISRTPAEAKRSSSFT